MGKCMKGSVACSSAGRDQGRFFVVLDVEGDFARIVDGKVRKLAAPKRKRLCHLAPTAATVETEGIRSDKHLRALLSDYNRSPKESTDTGGNELVKNRRH